ncbi:MAG: hypothetical protein HUK08_03725 [Bacteroidaceae bacterium]|nr:hypothetical protein [Bacteroidaceae bacterium]
MRKNLLFSFFMLLAGLIAGGGSASAQQTPADGGVYYIYNVESGQFLSHGNDWGTRVCTAPVGILWQVVAAEGGTYKLKTYEIICEVTDPAIWAMGKNCYADNNEPDNHAIFTFTGNSDGYTLVTADGNLSAPATAGDCSFSTAASTWQFLDKDDFATKMAAIKSAQEKNVATAAGITLGESQTLAQVVGDESNWHAVKTSDGIPTKASWNAEKGNSPAGGESNEGADYGCEFYNTRGSYSKTITGLKKGIYKVTFKGLKRMTGNAPCFKIGKTDGYTNSDAYFTANGNSVQIKDWASSCDETGGEPNSPAAAKAIWDGTTGGYNSEVFCYVGDDGKLEMKATSGAFWWGCWFLFGGVDYTYYTNQKDEATMAIGSAKWATFIAPFDVNIPAGVTANKVTGTDTNGKLVYEEITTGVIPANTPVVVNSETAVSEKFEDWGTATEPSYTVGLLTGVYAETSAPVASYVLQDQASNGLGFYKVVSGKQPKVAANHAYMTLPSGSMSARSFYSVDGGGTTVIDGIQASETGAEKEVIYDLSGRRVSNAGKGIYIVNGRKIVK